MLEFVAYLRAAYSIKCEIKLLFIVFLTRILIISLMNIFVHQFLYTFDLIRQIFQGSDI